MMMSFDHPQANLWVGQQFRPESGGEDFPVVEPGGDGAGGSNTSKRRRWRHWCIIFFIALSL